ncbi:MAG: hypothetical protein K0R57_2533 [Paenibacillaceae bacterium]|jgi:Fe-Mn family superoxide dismutase|nr:hypothetical protein [Paenibacillaceae bacterium]
MLTVYGPLMPLRLLEEIRFWKMQEKEHTVVIRELVVNLEREYVQVLKEWEPIFSKTEAEATQWIEALLHSPAGVSPYMQMQIEGLLNQSLQQSKAFISQLMHMLSHSKATGGNPTAQVVVQHITRESEYFLGVLHAFTGSASPAAVPAPGSIQTERASGSDEDPAAGNGVSRLGRSFSSATFFPLRQQSLTESASEAYTHYQPGQPSGAPVAGLVETETAHVQSPFRETWSSPTASTLTPIPSGGHTLPPLPYPYDALEPYIDAETMKLHHDKHHQSYVDGLNNAEKKLEDARKSQDFSLVKHWERELAFHGAGHYLHTIFWNAMAPKAGGPPRGPAAAQIQQDFGSFDAFKKQFSEAADKVEGGGWAIWVWSPRSGRTEILTAEKHQNLSQWDVVPLLPLDVWEHAYYLKYQNKRPDYIKAWWNVVNWKHVNERLNAAKQLVWTPY